MKAATLAAGDLQAWCARLLQAAGCAPAIAQRVAQSLVLSNLKGHDSHGVGLLPMYLDHLRQGSLRPDARLQSVVDRGSLLTLDGGAGFGQVNGPQAMRLGIERARQHGCAVVGLHNTHHLGRIGEWAEQCADAGMASVHFVNVISQPLVAPWGGTAARLATNPFCVGMPAPEGHVVLDYATSAVAWGKTRVAMQEGRELRAGLVLDADGQASCDPSVMWREPRGAILPFGEHKGYALAVMCELLGGLLSGGSVLDRCPAGDPTTNNMLSILIDSAALVPAGGQQRQLQALREWLAAAPGAAVRLPGDPEREHLLERSEHGVRVDAATLARLDEAASSFHIDALAPHA